MKCLQLLTAAAWATSALAQVPLSGNLSDATTGPLLAGTVYHATGNLTVPSNATLTAQPGAIVKFSTIGSQLGVSGTLLVQGSPANPVIFTDIRDDTAGGDTNGDGGATVPAPGWWRGLSFGSTSDASTVDFGEVRYGGAVNLAGIELNSADITLRDSRVVSCAKSAIDLNATSAPTLQRVHCQGNGGVAIDRAPIESVPAFDALTAVGNGGDYVLLSDTSVSANTTIGVSDLIGGVLVVPGSLSVSASVALTLDKGVIVKMAGSNSQLTISGTLVCSGTQSEPVVWTEFRDDAFGGDTNNDGPSNGTPGWWRGLLFQSNSDASLVAFTRVRFGGASGFAGFDLTSADITVGDSRVELCAANGFNLSANSYPTLERVHCEANGGIAIDEAPIEALPAFDAPTAANNGGNYVRASDGSVTANTTLAASDLIDGVLVLNGNLTVNPATTLRLEAGVVVKAALANMQVSVSGILQCAGTAGEPVVWTEFRDDAFGGDTNNDGPSSGSPGRWRGLLFNSSSDASVLDHTRVRFGGAGSQAGFELFGADITVRSSRAEWCALDGFDLNGSSMPTLEQVHCESNTGVAISGAPIEALPAFAALTAANNGGNYVRAQDGFVNADTTVDVTDLIGGVLVLPSSLTVNSATTLTLNAGVVVKLETANTQVSVSGALDTAGTDDRPVVFTDFRDDAYGGDTNNDGNATAPAKGWWRGVVLTSTATVSDLRGLLTRYTGASGYAGIDINGAGVKAEDIRAEHALAIGIDAATHGGDARGWTAFDCTTVGITLRGGSFDLRQATASVCGTGFNRLAGWTGTLTEAIGWQNGTQFANFAAGQLTFSNGDAASAGSGGNVNVDPRFVSPATGDLRLRIVSPCVDKGDPLSPPDPDGTRADMGAYPRDQRVPVVYCTAKVNSCGTLPSMSFAGKASVALTSGFVIRVTNARATKAGLLFYTSTGRAALPFQGGTLCVGPAQIKRSFPLFDTVGTPGQCDGVLSIDMAKFASGGFPTVPAPYLSQVGALVTCQFWGRDSVANGSLLSDALEYRVGP